MPPVCRGIRKATGANVVGLCHGTFHVAHELAAHLGVDFSRFRYTAVGINHMTWFTEVRIDGKDARPQLRKVAEQKLAELPKRIANLGKRFAEAGTANWEKIGR